MIFTLLKTPGYWRADKNLGCSDHNPFRLVECLFIISIVGLLSCWFWDHLSSTLNKHCEQIIKIVFTDLKFKIENWIWRHSEFNLNFICPQRRFFLSEHDTFSLKTPLACWIRSSYGWRNPVMLFNRKDWICIIELTKREKMNPRIPK